MDVCPQCGLIHPPVLAGEKCPMSNKDKTSTGEAIDSGAFIAQLRNIVISKIQSKKIKNHKKLFSAILVEMFRFLDQYKEE
jgi:hypothetical protein